MLRWLVLALVGSRLLVLTTGLDSVYFDEELSTGLIGVHLIDGLRLPFLDYQIAPHLGGTLLIGALSAPLFLLFGEHLLALKLAPLLLHVGAMVLWYRCCDRHFGRPAAILTAVLFIVPPQLLTRFSLVAVGFHPESLLFTAAAAWLLFRITSRPQPPLWCYLGLGCVWGLGTWFAYIFVPTIVTSLLYWTLVDRRWMVRRTALAVVLGGVVGLLPWLMYNVTHQWAGLAWLGGSGMRESLDLWTRLEAVARFLTVDLFRSFGSAFDGPVRRIVVPTLYFFTVLVGYLAAARAVVRTGAPVRPLAWLVLYPLVLAATYGANLGIGHGLGRIGHESYDGFRYLVPLYPVLLVLMAVMLTRAWQTGTVRRQVAGLVTLALLVAGLTSTLQLLSSRHIGRGAVYAATSYKEFAFQRGDGPVMDLDGLPTADRLSYLLGRGWSASDRLLQGAPRADDEALPRTNVMVVLPAEPGADPLGEQLTCAALGAHAVRLEPGDAVREVSGLGLSAACEWNAITALGASLRLDAVPYYQLDATIREYVQTLVTLAPAVPERSRAALFEGFGQGVGVGLELSVLDRLDVVFSTIEHVVTDTDRHHVYLGFGRGVGWRNSHDPIRATDLVARVNARDRSDAVRGLREFERRLSVW